MTLAVDLNDEKTWSLSGHYPLYRGDTSIIQGMAVRVMDENGRSRQEINKPYDFFIRQLQASYTVNGKVSEARVLVLPRELVNGYALTKNEVIELILNKVIRGSEPEDIYPEIRPYFIGPVDIEVVQKTDEKEGENMTEFIYEIPNEDKFLSAVLMMIRKKGHAKLASLLSGSKCSILTSSSYSRKRWNAYYTTIDFAIPQSKYDEVSTEIEAVTKESIRDICNEVMPAKAGYDVMDVTVSISLEDAIL
ncbi:hypothetical protein JXA31_10395 [Candidatus Bathyarchaeota archaeon]|nr:hypothetical protein [Candidatus Bathyarchaeota archaeon]